MEVKVLHVLRTYLPETENWLFHLLNNTNNIQHTIYCEKYSPGIFESKKFNCKPLPSSYEPVFNNSLFGKMNRLCHTLLLQLSGKTKQDFFIQLAGSEKPDVIHFHFGTMALIYKSVLDKIKIPFVVSFYGYDYNAKFNYKKIFSKATAIVCEGKAGKEQLIDLGCPEEKIVIVPLGIIPSENITAKNKPPGQLKLVQIASFTEKKGHIYTLQAVEKALAPCPDITLTLMGPDSRLKSNIEDYIRQKKLEKSIKMKPAVSPEQLSEELRKYDVFIHPSLTAGDGDNEGGAPVVLLNAQNVGLPVISTFHKDIPDYVIHEKTGFLAPEKDIDMLSRFIVTLYNMNDQTFQNFSSNAVKHVHINYDIRENAQKLSSLYHTIIKT